MMLIVQPTTGLWRAVKLASFVTASFSWRAVTATSWLLEQVMSVELVDLHQAKLTSIAA